MENKNKGDRNYSGCWIYYTLIGSGAWIALVIAKAYGAIQMNWPAAVLGIFWIPALLLGFILGLTGVVALLGVAGRKLQNRIREAVLKNLEGGRKNGRL